jgi:segregation and condensation protein B
MNVDPQHVRLIEAILFAAAEPQSDADLASRLPDDVPVGPVLAAIADRHLGGGMELARVGGKWQLRTAPDLAPLLRIERTVTRKLSRACLETLAIVAYHQPVTRAEIEEIRGVSISAGTLDQLVEMGWVKLGRRRMTPGRPMTFVVTQGFLDHFGLESNRDLPGVAELRAAGLLDNRPAPGAALETGGEEEAEEAGELF